MEEIHKKDGINQMKKLTAILALVLALIFVFCSCGDNSTTPAETTTTFTYSSEDTPIEPFEEEAWAMHALDSRLLIAANGFQHEFDSYGNAIVYYDENRCIVMSHYDRSLWLADANSKEVICISGEQKVIDYTVAYDTLYWFNLEREVWSCSWQSLDCTAKLFCEDAIAVSPFTDECEGAIVPPERANIDFGYGGLPIYSPYGMID